MGFLADLEVYFTKGLQIVKNFIVPMAQVAVQIIPGLPPITSKIVAKVPDMIAAMEQVFPENGAGPIKLAGVLAMAQAMTSTMVDVSKGGQAETWAKIQPIIENMVTSSVGVINSGKAE
jgi:hypothetical protein